MLAWRYPQNNRLYSDFTSFSHLCPFSVSGSSLGSHIAFSHQVFLVPSGVRVSQSFLVFHGLTTLEEDKSGIPQNACEWGFLMMRPRLRRLPFSSHSTREDVIATWLSWVMLNLTTLVKVVPARLLFHCKVVFPFLSFLKAGHPVQLILRGEGRWNLTS